MLRGLWKLTWLEIKIFLREPLGALGTIAGAFWDEDGASGHSTLLVRPNGSVTRVTRKGLAAMPWWAPLGGVVGAFAVIAGLLFVGKVGAGAFAGLTITANILMSLAIDRFGLFGMQVHELCFGRIAGAAFMVAGVTLISRF